MLCYMIHTCRTNGLHSWECGNLQTTIENTSVQRCIYQLTLWISTSILWQWNVMRLWACLWKGRNIKWQYYYYYYYYTTLKSSWWKLLLKKYPMGNTNQTPTNNHLSNILWIHVFFRVTIIRSTSRQCDRDSKDYILFQDLFFGA